MGIEANVTLTGNAVPSVHTTAMWLELVALAEIVLEVR
jgi:hypothetical protein